MVEEIKIVYVFPGQESLVLGMGLDLYVHSAAVRDVFDEVDRTLGFALSRLCFEGPEEDLKQTVNIQPAILTASVACLRAAQEASQGTLPNPTFVAGHGIGEYTALVVANVLTLSDAVRLVRERGRLMNEAGQRMPGGILSVNGLDFEVVRDVCASTGTEVAEIDAPDQTAISGTQENLAKARRLLQLKGARRVLPMKVSGPFHSSLMESAVGRLRNAIAGFSFKQPIVPVIANVTAQPLSDIEAIKEELISQIVHTIRWQQSIETMIARGISTFFEMGPGEEMTKLIKRISPGVQTFNVNDTQTVGEIARWRMG